MNNRMIRYVIGRILLVEAALLLLPMLVALIYGERAMPFLIPILLLTGLGLLLGLRTPARTELFARDGLAIVATAWIFMSLFGALPFYLSGSMHSYVDCVFETWLRSCWKWACP